MEGGGSERNPPEARHGVVDGQPIGGAVVGGQGRPRGRGGWGALSPQPPRRRTHSDGQPTPLPWRRLRPRLPTGHRRPLGWREGGASGGATPTEVGGEGSGGRTVGKPHSRCRNHSSSVSLEVRVDACASGSTWTPRAPHCRRRPSAPCTVHSTPSPRHFQRPGSLLSALSDIPPPPPLDSITPPTHPAPLPPAPLLPTPPVAPAHAYASVRPASAK